MGLSGSPFTPQKSLEILSKVTWTFELGLPISNLPERFHFLVTQKDGKEECTLQTSSQQTGAFQSRFADSNTVWFR